MATTIKLKNGSGAPLASDLVQGEPALDLTNKRLYTEDSGGTVIEIGTTPTSLNTTGTVTFGNLSDGTITVTAFVDEDNMASNSATLIPTQQSVKAYVDSQVASADTLAELTDTNITTPADGALLFYDTGTSKWIDNVVSGDITIADTGVAAIEAGVIVNADVNASAAIDVSKTALTAGTGLTLTTNTLSVDASQTQITSVGTLSSLSVSGTITSGDITVSDGTPFIRLQDSDITNGYTQVANTNGNGYIGARNDTADGIFAVGGYGGGTFTEWARWNTTGKLIQNYDLEIQGAFTSLGIDDNATSTAITINSSENVGIGTTDPSDGKLQIAASATAGVFVRDSLASAAAPYIRVQGQRQDANGSESFSGGLVLEHYRTDAAIVNNKALGTIYFGGNHTDGSESNIAYGASIVGKAEGTFNSASDMPTGLAFFTGSTGRALGTANVDYGDERMRIDSSGVVSFSYGISEQYNAVSDSSGTTTVDLSTGTNFSSTLSANTTFAFTNPAASGKVSAFTLKIVQDASASGYTVTWPASVDWPSATAPTLTATASAVDYFVFITHDGGTTWYGFTAGQAFG